MAAEEVEEDSLQITDNKKSEETSWSVTNTRLVIDLYRDNPVLYDKRCEDYENQVAMKKVFSPMLVKFKNTITIEEIKKRSLKEPIFFFFNPELFAAMLDV